MDTQILEKAKNLFPFSAIITVEPKDDMHIGILFNNKPPNKIEKEFSKDSKIKILITANFNYNGLEVTICTDDKMIDHYTIPNKKWNYQYSIVLGSKCIAANTFQTSTTGYLLIDLLLTMIMNKQYISNINVNIPNAHYLQFKSNDDMLYHYYNLIINAVCKSKKIIELSYTLNHNVKYIRVYSNENCFILKRSDRIVEYTIDKDKYYMVKSSEDSKDLFFIKSDHKVNIDITRKIKGRQPSSQLIKNDIELYKVIQGNI